MYTERGSPESLTVLKLRCSARDVAFGGGGAFVASTKDSLVELCSVVLMLMVTRIVDGVRTARGVSGS